VESDVTTTLSELERKLKELERELESVGRGGELDAEPAQAGWTPPPDPPPAPAPGPPPPGATPFTAVWHGTGADAGPPPAPPYEHAEPVRVTPPAAPWGAAAAPPQHAAPSRGPQTPAFAPAPPRGPETPAFAPAPPPAAPDAFAPAPQGAAPHAFAPAPQGAAPPAFAPPPQHAAPPRGPETHAFAPAPPPAPPSGLHAQLDELLAFRDRLVRTTDDLVSELSRVLTELGVGAAPDLADTPLSGDVVVEAGTFADLATLAAFEQALASVPGVTSVYVRSLDAGRAAIDVRLAGAVALGSALRAVVPVPLTVTDARDGHLAIALAPAPGG
jgi:hypothetical protein